MIGLWAGIGLLLWLIGCEAWVQLWPLKPSEIQQDTTPRPLCACSRRGPASMNMGRLGGNG
jgi:hypothetical protein